MKIAIEQALQHFNTGDFNQNALNFFETLGYNTDYQQPLSEKNYQGFKQAFKPLKNEENGLVSDWLSVEQLFFLTPENIPLAALQVDNVAINAYLVFSIELAKLNYSRTDLVKITRELNGVFPHPVLVLFKHGNSLTLSVIHRRINQNDNDKDVIDVKKVSILKDISILNPHRAHLDILFDVSLPELKNQFKIENFVNLHNAWLKVFSIDKLNKRFYQDISNWYFWATAQVKFPQDTRQDKSEAETNSIAVIRLITRLIFVWFIKEKGLVPEHLFDKTKLDAVLNYADKTNSTYYKAILQNLFFATLNTENTEENPRSFISDVNYQGKNKNHFQHNLYRYQRFFKQPESALELFKDVPFLNGGLFDCLDVEVQENGEKIGEIRVDYFSDYPPNEKKLAVPDILFFSDKVETDLNEIYGTKNKKYVVRGLIPLLNAYKFTITENTPLEEEIALDPELLGKVFENLLAAYDPENGKTARKQTGSFYTPREIVDYMVDESLIAYFSNLPGLKDLEGLLRDLLSYNASGNPFNSEQTIQLIKAIDNCKILDPACGSGAFPMGILNKLVFVLSKLDPKNERWKQRQIDKLNVIDDTKLREEAEEVIEKAFKNNELDYGRKLFLIRECIFGVDIQPIAVQIAKLRFFISLVIDQRVNDELKNRGIQPLPNMEMKLIAANSLIGLDFKIAQGDLLYDSIRVLESKIKAVRLDYFSANNRQKKTVLKEKEQDLLKELEQELINVQCGTEQAHKIVAWNPYNQNANADFFDSEFMFGLNNGFDIVIGNPPYIQIQKFSGQQCQKDWQNQHYATFEKTGDIYALFIEKGVSLLKQNGLLTFITSNKWMRAGYGKSLRNFLATKTHPLKLIDFGGYQVFESATVDSNILITQTVETQNFASLHACTIQKDFTIETNLADYFTAHQQTISLKSTDAWVIASGIEQQIKAKIEAKGTPLKEWDVNINYGIKTGFNEAFIIDTATKERLCNEDAKSAEIIKPILRGRDIKRYQAEWAGLWLIYSHAEIKENDYPAIKNYLLPFKDTLLKRRGGANPKTGEVPYEWWQLQVDYYKSGTYKEFEKEKISWGNLALSPQYSFIDKGFYINAPCPIITPANKYILAVLNSPVSDYYIRKLGVTRNGGYFEYKPMFIEQLPIPKISPEQQQPFIELVDKILAAKKQNPNTAALEREIDEMVYALYGLSDDEIKIVEGGK